jgi:hypothetical protein
MAVLVEGISVIIRRSKIEEVMSWDEFQSLVPNATLCADDEIARVGFMGPADTKAFMQTLEAKGLRYLCDGKAKDITVVDQQEGLMTPTPWLEVGHIELNGNRIAAARLKDSNLKTVLTPHGWEYEGSLTQSFSFLPLRKE